MKTLSLKSRTRAFTLVDLIIVIATVFFLWTFMRVYHRPRALGNPPRCISNLKQIGLAFRIFANENDERYPFAVPRLTNEHTGILLTSNATTAKVWMHFQALSNELQSAKVLICREDRSRLDNFADDFLDTMPKSLSHSTKRDSAVSYFVGLPADETKPQAILAGDRNLSAERRGKFYSSTTAGSAIHASQTSVWSDAWPPTCHGTQGNVVLADGSVQQATTQKLQQLLASATNAYGTNINLFLFPQ